MHKKRWAAFVLAAALVLTGCSAGSFLHFGKGSGGVRLAVTEAVAALTGLPADRITVVQWDS